MGDGKRTDSFSSMMYSLSISTRAQKEIAEAFLWDVKKSRSVAERLIGVVDDKLLITQHNPLQYPAVHKIIHRALIKKFAYSIFYLIAEDRIEVLAFFHTRRKPIEWEYRKFCRSNNAHPYSTSFISKCND